MASIRKRSLPSGKSVWLVDYQDQSGKRRARQFATKRKAGSYLVRARAAVLHGTHVHGADSVPVAPASQRWLEACARRCQTGRRMECATYQDCEAKLRLHLLDHEVGLGGVKLTRLTRGAVAEFRDCLLAAGRSEATTRKVLSCLSLLLAHA